ncbi:hypothetical protein F4804DRAFT_329843 [Jackrogersella minutella]|nr:hypothetical protein F4804DRAFT_329843 [Jackrogersella minutella]
MGEWQPGGFFLTKTQHIQIIRACLMGFLKLVPEFLPSDQIHNAIYYASCEEDCRHFIQKAIDAIPATKNRQKTTDYIRNKLDGEFERWATYPRFRIPILLQVLTTSPLEGLHASYKADGMKKTMQTFALQ